MQVQHERPATPRHGVRRRGDVPVRAVPLLQHREDIAVGDDHHVDLAVAFHPFGEHLGKVVETERVTRAVVAREHTEDLLLARREALGRAPGAGLAQSTAMMRAFTRNAESASTVAATTGYERLNFGLCIESNTY